MYEINLQDITQDGNKKITSLGGKENGLNAAKKLNIKQIASENETVKIIIPEYINGFHSSYFAGLFSEVISDLKNNKKDFLDKFIFDARDIILEQINDAIDLCFMDTSAIKLK